MNSGIYKIENKNTGEVYIGQSDNCERRLSEHKQKRFVPIDMWINVLGVDNFTFEIIETCPKEELDQKEQKYIEFYNSKETGYNQQNGGFNNSSGEGNGRAKVNVDDVIKIRTAYAERKSQKEVYEQFKEKITFSQFQRIWQGNSWSNIMPEVYTSENKHYYVYELKREKASLTSEEVLYYRQYYMTHTRDEVYIEFCKNKGNDFMKKGTFTKILIGDVRENSIYKQIPIYKKAKKQWLLNGNPVSTISGSGE